MNRIGIRELRNDTSGVVRRAMAGERIVVTVNGVPAAVLGPLNDGERAVTVDDLIAAGLVRAPQTRTPSGPPRPLRAAPGSPTTTEVLREHRNR